MEATKEKIIELIKEAAGDHVDVTVLKADAPLADQGTDSLDRISVFLAVEEAYGIRIPDSDYAKLRTINDIIEYLKKS